MLNAMEGVKRTELFENLRKAHGSNTISKKLAVLNATPNVLVKDRQSNSEKAGTVSQPLPFMSPNPSNFSLIGAQDPMKPPTLKQLRMEAI